MKWFFNSLNWIKLCNFYCIHGHFRFLMTLFSCINFLWRFPDAFPLSPLGNKMSYTTIEIQVEHDMQWLHYFFITYNRICLIFFNTCKPVLNILQRESIFCFHETFSSIIIPIRLGTFLLLSFLHQVVLVYCLSSS